MPVKLNIYLTFSCLLFFSNAYSQDSAAFKTQHAIAFLSGYNRHIVKDDIISPLVYSGSQVPMLLKWQFNSKRAHHAIFVYYDHLKLTSSITIKAPTEVFFAKNYNAFIEYSYHRKLYTYVPWNSSVFAGPELMFLLNLRDHYYNNYTHYNTGELIGSLGISFLVLKRFTHSNDYFSFRSSTAIMAYDMLNYLYNANVPKKLKVESNQNTYGDLIKNNRPVTINKYFEFNTETSYTKFISKHMGIELKHYFQFYKSEKFEDLFYTKYVNNQFLIGVIVKM